MTQTYFPFDSGAGANSMQAQWQQMAQNWLATGVLNGALNQLQVYADSTGLQCKVKSGQAWMEGHFFQSDAEEVLPISTADSTNPRIDRVIVRVDWVADTIQLSVLQGVPATSPTAPALTQNTSRWEISLAQVRVNAGVTTIASGNITDERTFSQNVNIQQPSMLSAPLVAPLVPDGGRGIRYFKDTMGFVHIWIDVDFTADRVTSATLGTLAAGYAPKVQIDDIIIGFNNALNANPMASLIIDTSGNIKIGTPTAGVRWLHKAIPPFRVDV